MKITKSYNDNLTVEYNIPEDVYMYAKKKSRVNRVLSKKHPKIYKFILDEDENFIKVFGISVIFTLYLSPLGYVLASLQSKSIEGKIVLGLLLGLLVLMVISGIVLYGLSRKFYDSKKYAIRYDFFEAIINDTEVCEESKTKSGLLKDIFIHNNTGHFIDEVHSYDHIATTCFFHNYLQLSDNRYIVTIDFTNKPTEDGDYLKYSHSLKIK